MYRERVPFDKLQREIPRAVRFLKVINAADIGMIQSGQRFRLTLESRQPLRIAAEFLRQRFDGDFTPELRIPRTVDLAHTSAAEKGKDFVGAELGTSGEAHFAFADQLRMTVMGCRPPPRAKPGRELMRKLCPSGTTS